MPREKRACAAVCVLFLPLLTACDVGINFWENEVVHVDVPAAAPKTFSGAQDVTLGSASHELPVGRLDAVQIPEIKLTVADIGADNVTTTLSGTLTITDASDTTFEPATLTFQNLPVTSTGELSVTPSTEDITRLQPALLGNHPLRVTCSVSMDALPASFQLTAAIHVIAEVAL
jgi:hypothetical protein